MFMIYVSPIQFYSSHFYEFSFSNIKVNFKWLFYTNNTNVVPTSDHGTGRINKKHKSWVSFNKLMFLPIIILGSTDTDRTSFPFTIKTKFMKYIPGEINHCISIFWRSAAQMNCTSAYMNKLDFNNCRNYKISLSNFIF